MEQKWKCLFVLVLSFGTSALLVSETAFAQAAKTVKIGYAAVLSGAFGHYGKDMEYAAKIAIEEANAKKLQIGGQTINFELVSEDDMADPKTGTAVAQRLVDKGVVAVIGHFNSGTSIPASRIYYEAGIPQVSPTATNPRLTKQGFKSVFRVINTDAQIGYYAGRYAVQEFKAKRIGIIDDRTAAGQGMAEEFEKSVRASGGNIVGHEYTTDKSVDFAAILTKFKSQKIDFLFFAGLDAQAAPMVRQMNQFGISAPLMGGGGVTTKNFVNTAGTAANGTLSWDYGLPIEDMPGGKGLITKMKDRFNVDTENYAPFTYDATSIVINAMIKANSVDPKAFLPALAATNYTGVTGKITFDNKGDLVDPPATLYEVKKQEWARVKTFRGM